MLKREGWWNIVSRLNNDGDPRYRQHGGFVYANIEMDATVAGIPVTLQVDMPTWRASYKEMLINWLDGTVPDLTEADGHDLPPNTEVPPEYKYNESWNWVAYISAYGDGDNEPLPGVDLNEATYFAWWCGDTNGLAAGLNMGFMNKG